LESLRNTLGGNADKRIYIIAPINAVDFIGDYHEIEGVRFYFLKIPYQVIRELHNAEFEKIRQPKSKSNLNDLENAVGFHFGMPPEAKSQFKNGVLTIKEFYSNFKDEAKGDDFENFETLSMVIIDADYNGKDFNMTLPLFNDEIERVNGTLKITLENYGDTIFVIYIDIFGLVVTSDKDHKDNALHLPYVDSKEDAVEWIISVAMLTEGWDVKNVFQIVPMEERAFN
jgi:site-specific DNA-methyltransferase (adenine-specific)/adenine-specific DNA-methyltransferase